MNTYKNITDQELVVSGVGIVAPGGTIETEGLLESPNLTLQSSAAAAPVTPVTSAPAAAPTTPPAAPPVATEPPATQPITPN